MDEQKPQTEPTPTPAPVSAPAVAPQAPAEEERHRWMAACSYLGILFLIPLIADKDDEFVRFHLRQGMVLFGLSVIASFGFLNESVGSMLMLAIVVISIAAAWRTFQGKKWLLPIIGKYAQKITL